MTDADDVGHLRDLDDALRDIFPLQLWGISRSLSEYGLPYVTIANGFIKCEGAVAVDQNLPDAVSGTISYFKKRRADGDDVLVWRILPAIYHEGAMTRLYMRCHTMKRSAIRL